MLLCVGKFSLTKRRQVIKHKDSFIFRSMGGKNNTDEEEELAEFVGSLDEGFSVLSW